MNTQKAIQAIDAVTVAIVNGVINTSFIDESIYGKLDNELYKHILNKWASKKGDVFDFYLNSNDDIKRWLLEALDVEVEPVKYPTMATVKDAAAKFGISEYFLRNLCRAGKVRFVCVGNRWLVNLDSLAAYFNEGDDPAELESRHG